MILLPGAHYYMRSPARCSTRLGIRGRHSHEREQGSSETRHKPFRRGAGFVRRPWKNSKRPVENLVPSRTCCSMKAAPRNIVRQSPSLGNRLASFNADPLAIDD